MIKILSFKKSLHFFSVIVLASMIEVWDARAMFNGEDDQKEPPLVAKMTSPSLDDQKSEDTPEILNQRGVQYLEEKNYFLARDLFKKAAKQGLFIAQCNLGAMYMFGQGIPQNIAKAMKWFKNAFSQETDLFYHVGVLFCNAGNYEAGLPYFEKALEGGHPDAKTCIADAQCDIGTQCCNAQNYSIGLEWFEKAKKNGHPEGTEYIIKTLITIGIDYSKAEKFTEALEAFTKAARHGSAEAQNIVGLHYHEGTRVPKDDSEAMNWLMLAVQQEHSGAGETLSEIYYKALKDANDVEAEKWFVRAVTQGYDKVKQKMIEAQYRVGAKYYIKKMFPDAMKFFMKAAENGHGTSSYNVGAMHYKGEGVPQSDTKAKEWFEKAKKNEHKGVQTGEVQIGIGTEYRQKGKFLKAIEWFEWGAKEGHTGCLYNLGIMNLEGIGVAQNEPKALEYFERALENASTQKKSSIHYNIGLGYYHNENFPKAFEWFQKSAAQDNKDALFGIGLLHHRGEGVPQDPVEALKWYKKAKKSGHPEAQPNIAEAQFMIGLQFNNSNNFIEAMKWYHKASKKNHGRAQHNIAIFHLNGEGVPEDSFEAIKWFKIARENGGTGTREGIALAQANIGEAFYENKNFIEAVNWSKKAAKKGHSQAQFNIGVAYNTGLGVTKDPYEALRWFEMAKESGNPEAQNALAETQWNIAIECRDKENFSEALKWFEKANGNGDLEAYKEIEIIKQKMKK